MLQVRTADVLKEGVYELLYRSEAEPHAGYDSLLLALRNGNILGSDRWGGVFLGRCEFDQQTCQHHITVRLHVPPGGTLVTDDAPCEAGQAIDVAFDFGSARDLGTGIGGTGFGETQIGLVEVGGQQVRVELQYKGPVPR